MHVVHGAFPVTWFSRKCAHSFHAPAGAPAHGNGGVDVEDPTSYLAETPDDDQIHHPVV